MYTVTANYSGDNTYAPSSGTFTQTITGQAGLINFVDFETGDFSQTASHINGAIVSSPALAGNFSLQLQRNNSVANAEIRQSGTMYYSVPTVYYSFLFEYTSNSGDGGIANFQDDSSNFKAALHLSSSGMLLFYGYSAFLGMGTTMLNPNQVYTLSVEVGTGPNAPWEVRINGNVELSGTGDLGANNNGSINLGGNSRYTNTYYYDNVAIDSQGYPPGGGAVSRRASSGRLLANPILAATPTSAPLGSLSSSTVGTTVLEVTPVTILDQPWLLRSTRQGTGSTWREVGVHRHMAQAAIDSFFAQQEKGFASAFAPLGAL
jgi:hypothetical protein